MEIQEHHKKQKQKWSLKKLQAKFVLAYGSFPPSGTGQYSMVRYGSGPNTLIQLAFLLPTVPLLDRRGVCRKVAIDDKARQSAQFCLFLLNVSFNEQ